jgi:putative hemolysin
VGSVTRHLVVLTVVALAASAGCGDDDDQPSDTTTAGLANPASVFCVSQGGEVEIVSEAAGQVGYCNLPDGTRVEEWEYFRAHAPTTTTAP